MRLVPGKPIRTKGCTLGDNRPLVCVPMVEKTKEAVLNEAANISQLAADVVELRIDAWDCVEDVKQSLALISEIRSILKNTPIILTCRGHWEGGFKEVSEVAKDAIYNEAIDAELIDFVDKELCYGPEVLKALQQRANSKNIHLIVSYHDFKKTPSKEFIYSQLVSQIRCGADVAKIAVMPQTEEDVLSLLGATLAVRRDFPDYPLITMSMGKLGAVSRIVGCLFGSDLSFAVGSAASAPGQIPVAELQASLDILLSE